MKNKFKFLSLSAKGGKAKFTMMLPFGGAHLSMEAAMRAAILTQIKLAAAEVGQETESLGVGVVSQWGAQPAPIQFDTVDELLPKESDYYYKDFRAISATLAPCYGLDFSKPGVLEASAPLLKGQTVYKDHIYHSVDYWVGAISESVWDGKDTAARGVPGINVKLKLDAKKDPMLVRGVAMEPPAVHSFSVTVFFEFEFSHPDLIEQGRFWDLLMEEVENELVRLVITKIDAYWEGSFVFQGAQEENKQIPANADAGGDDEEEMGAKRKQRMNAGGGTTTTQRSETVKISAELRKLLGLPDTQGEDVPDAVLLPAITTLGARAQAGDALMETARTECRRAAALATLGSAEGTLPDVLAGVIEKADATQLSQLTALYTSQAAERFPQGGRSSVEDSAAIHQAGGITEPAKKPVKRVPVY